MTENKPQIKLVFIGPYHSGKSTLVGHLLFKSGYFPKESLEEFQQDSCRAFKPTYMYAWMSFDHENEKKFGKTIKNSVWEYDEDKYTVTLVDTPGSKEYISEMIDALSEADCAVLVISLDQSYECDLPYIKEQILTAKTLGITQLIIALNKTETTNPPFSQARYEAVKNELSTFLKEAGLDLSSIIFLPLSGFFAFNLVKPLVLLPWFEGWKIEKNGETLTGVTFMDALETLVPNENIDDQYLKAERLQAVYRICGINENQVQEELNE